MNTFIEKVKQIIEANIYCTIATATLEGKPWISPVFFAFDHEYNLYWTSDKIYKLSDGEYINGQYVDRLKEIKF